MKLADVERELTELGQRPKLSSGEEERFSRLQRERTNLQARRKEIEARLERREYVRSNATNSYDGWPSGRTATSVEMGEALRGLESRDQPQKNPNIIQAAVNMIEADPTGTLAERAAVTGTPEYTSAFLKFMRDPVRGHLTWTEEEAAAWRRADMHQRATLSEGATSTGGALVPIALDPAVIITGAGSINSLRTVARTVTTPTAAWRGVSAGQVSASFDLPGTEVSDDAPSFEQPNIPVQTERAFIMAELELLDDTDLASEVTRLFSDAIDNLEREEFTNGSGVAPHPQGLLYEVENTTSCRVTMTTSGAFTEPDIYKLVEAVPPRHQPNANFMCSLPIMNMIRRFASSGSPSSAFWSDLAGSSLTPGKLLGLPIHQNSAMPTDVTSGGSALVCGDFQKFLIADHVGGAHLEVVPHVLGTNNMPLGVRGWFLWRRTGSGVLDTDAFRVLQGT
jgi:HK97 family phage major capsid protein